jgi:hypothetical protein
MTAASHPEGRRHPLERLLAPVTPPGLSDPPASTPTAGSQGLIDCRPGSGEPATVRAGDLRMFVSLNGSGPGRGEVIDTFRASDGRHALAYRQTDGRVVVPFSLADAYHGYTIELWAKAANRGLHPGALNAFYRLKRAIPRRLQLAARRVLIRRQGTPTFPEWPFDGSVAGLLRLYVRYALTATQQTTMRFRWFWPGGARSAVILTHDVESAAGLRNAVRIADLEQERGLRSSFNIVAREYPIDWGIVDELRQRGFELGVHGVFHDRSLFSSRQEFDRQQLALREMRERLGAEGFRSPATHRVNAWLADLPVSYDCTVPMSDPYEPQPGGCCSPWPFFVGDVVELPYTLPQDHTTFTLLRERTIDLWLRQLDLIEGSAGLAQCVSHPDPGYLGDPDKEALYAEFLDALAERKRIWRALPREAAAWWRERDNDESDPGPGEAGIATLDEGGSLSLTYEGDRSGASDPEVPWRLADEPVA